MRWYLFSSQGVSWNKRANIDTGSKHWNYRQRQGTIFPGTVQSSSQWNTWLHDKKIIRLILYSEKLDVKHPTRAYCLSYGFSHLLLQCDLSPQDQTFHSKLSVNWIKKEFVMYCCDVVSFPLVSWVRCGVWLYLFLIFDLFLTLMVTKYSSELAKK